MLDVALFDVCDVIFARQGRDFLKFDDLNVFKVYEKKMKKEDRNDHDYHYDHDENDRDP